MGDGDRLVEACCGIVGKGCTPQMLKRDDDPYCLKRFFTTLYLLIRLPIISYIAYHPSIPRYIYSYSYVCNCMC